MSTPYDIGLQHVPLKPQKKTWNNKHHSVLCCLKPSKKRGTFLWQNRWVTGVITPKKPYEWVSVGLFHPYKSLKTNPKCTVNKNAPSDDIRGQHHFSPIGRAPVDDIHSVFLTGEELKTGCAVFKNPDWLNRDPFTLGKSRWHRHTI